MNFEEIIDKKLKDTATKLVEKRREYLVLEETLFLLKAMGESLKDSKIKVPFEAIEESIYLVQIVIREIFNEDIDVLKTVTTAKDKETTKFLISYKENEITEMTIEATEKTK